LAVAPDTDYVVVLGARDGHVYDAARVRWSREDLIGIDPAERSLRKRKATAALHNRRVELTAPFDDVSVPPFIEEYNQAIDKVAKAYEAKKARESAIDPLAAPIVGALFPGALESPVEEGPEVDQAKTEHIVIRHFTLELVDANVFTARLPADPNGSSRTSR
jgi:hypothetical protein